MLTKIKRKRKYDWGYQSQFAILIFSSVLYCPSLLVAPETALRMTEATP